MPQLSSTLRHYLGRLLLRWAARLLLPTQRAGDARRPRLQTASQRASLGLGAGGAGDAPAAAHDRAAPRPPATRPSAAPEREPPAPRLPSATGHENPVRSVPAPPLPAGSARRAARAPLARLFAAARAWTTPTRNGAHPISEARADAPPRTWADEPAQVENSVRPPPHAPPPSLTAPRPVRAVEPPPPAAVRKTRDTPPADTAAPRKRARRVPIDELLARATPAVPAAGLAQESPPDGVQRLLRRDAPATDLAAAARAARPRSPQAEQRAIANPRAGPWPVPHEPERRTSAPARPAVEPAPLARAERATPLDQWTPPRANARSARRAESATPPAAPIRRWPSLPGEGEAAAEDSHWPALLADFAPEDRHLDRDSAARHARRLKREQRGEQWNE